MPETPATLEAAHGPGENAAGFPSSATCFAAGEDGGAAPASAGPALRPALFARYGNLTELRYDYPLILARNKAGEAVARPLTSMVDAVLQQIAPRGAEGEQLRSHVLGLEEEMRTLVARGGRGPLAQLWDRAARSMLERAADSARSALQADLEQTRLALALEGEIIDCDALAPIEMVKHLWLAAEERKARRFHAVVDRLIHGLTNLLQADFMRAPEAWTPERLGRSFGGAYARAFDFSALGEVIRTAACGNQLPEARRRRITEALAVLKGQRFFPASACARRPAGEEGGYSLIFETCGEARRAFDDRRRDMAAVVRAMAVASLELENRYRESEHDAALARIDGDALSPGDIARFPSFLVCIQNIGNPEELAALIDLASSGLPMKLLVVSDDILGEWLMTPARAGGRPKASDFASMIMGLEDVFVLQGTSSHLHRMADDLRRGMDYAGPAVFSIFSGCGTAAAAFPPYLVAAAALESRAFPAFTYDPAAGDDWAARFSIGGNPQGERDWPGHEFTWEDDAHQRRSETVAFAFPDFVACDSRYRKLLHEIPPGESKEKLLPVCDYLETADEDRSGKAAYVLMVDETNRLTRRRVDGVVMRAARACARRWRRLQELGGVNNSHARRLLAQEREKWEAEPGREVEKARTAPSDGTVDAAKAQPAPGPVSPAEPSASSTGGTKAKPSTDEPYIETPRCTSCEECIKVNNRMFAYNENKQAYLADPDAGPYRDLVRAAENCQVCIIHPGKPRNPEEPGLDELVKRAEAFR